MNTRLFTTLAPEICCLCDDRGLPGLDLCTACYDCLPHNLHCCYQCAAPLPQPFESTIFALSDQKCGRCLSESSAIDRAIIPFLYRPPVDYMIKRLKFSAQTKFSRSGGELLADAVSRADCITLPDALLPVPIHRQRLVKRGFNQARMIAHTIGKRLRIPVIDSALKRRSLQLPQSSLSARQRELNIKRAFTVVDKAKVRGLEVAIVDDVYTTGATARAIAAHLKKAGVTRVSIWTIARTP